MAYKRPPSVEEKYAALFLSDYTCKADEYIVRFARRMTDEQAAQMREGSRMILEALQGALDAMPEGTREQIVRTVANTTVKMGPKTVGKIGDGYTCVADRHLDVLIGAAVSSECAICMRRGDEVKKCALREALRGASDLVLDAKKGECGYAGKMWEAGV